MASKRSEVTLIDDRPALDGRLIEETELLEVKSGGRWATVFLSQGEGRRDFRPRQTRWVFRFTDAPDTTILAVGSRARRATMPRADQAVILAAARDRLQIMGISRRKIMTDRTTHATADRPRPA